MPLHWALYFSSYERLKHELGGCPHPGDTSFKAAVQTTVTSGAAAVAAAVLTDTMTNPLWVIRTRLMTQHVHLKAGQVQPPLLSGPVDALWRISRTEGVGALYRGLHASWMASMHVCVQFPVYELLRRSMLARRRRQRHPRQQRAYPAAPPPAPEQPPAPRRRALAPSPLRAQLVEASDEIVSHLPPDHLHWAELLVAASVSKLAASVASYPVELLRSHMQDTGLRLALPGQPSAFATAPPSMRATFSSIVATEGVWGLYAGFGANLLRVLPACCITMLAYENLARRLSLHGW